MPVYRCRFLDRAGNPVMIRVASETDAEAIGMARSIITISGADGFELWHDERWVHSENAGIPIARRAHRDDE